MLSADLLDRLYGLWEEGERHDAAAELRAHKRLNITPATGKFLYQMIRSGGCTQVLEVGTSTGYSTLWAALALHDRDSSLVSVDIDADKQRRAADNLGQFGLAGKAELVCQDAGRYLAARAANSADLIFLDAERSQYLSYWPDFRRIMRRGSLLVMDNALSHEHECADFIRVVLASEGYLAETYDIGKGQFVIVKD